MGSPVQPLLNLRSRLGEASRQFLDAHPINAAETMLGIPLGEPAQSSAQSGTGTLPPQWEAANRIAEQQALADGRRGESLQPRRKPLGKQATGY